MNNGEKHGIILYCRMRGTMFCYDEKERWEIRMLNFEKELEKFEPSKEVEGIEELIRHNDVSDVTDLIKEILKENRNN